MNIKLNMNNPLEAKVNIERQLHIFFEIRICQEVSNVTKTLI